MKAQKPNCVLCLSEKTNSKFVKKKTGRAYWECSNCRLIFLEKSHLLSEEDEKNHYHTHDNNVLDPRYQNFVSDVVDFVKKNIPNTAKGLDFGAGLGPVISHLLQQDNYQIKLYDPFFHPEKETLAHVYDFIVSCEVIEHFRNPHAEFKRLSSLLNTGGALVVKSQFFDDDIDFPTWYYHGDPTHISFYHAQTIQWIQENFAFKKAQRASKRVYVLWK